jgi:hypothetical protein
LFGAGDRGQSRVDGGRGEDRCGFHN